MEANALELRAVPAGRNGTVTLTAYLGDNAVAVDKIDISKGTARVAFAELLIDKLPGIDRGEVDKQLLRLAAEHASRPEPSARPTHGTTVKTAAELLAEMPADVRESANQLLESPELMKRIVDDVAALGVAGEKELIVTTYLCGTSRLLRKPLALIAQGPSSSGKSHCVATAAQCFPPEAVIIATQLTPQSLFYLDPGSLKHRFVVVGERSRVENDDTAEATRALREMLSAGRLSKLVTMKVDGAMKTVLIEQEGPIAYVESTTLTKLFNEDANRCIILNTDERPEQTRRIIQNIAATYAGMTTAVDRERIIAQHHAVQRMLVPYDVVIPFAAKLGELFQSQKTEARRAFPQLLHMMQASALLHQRQRKIDPDGRLVAEADDYKLARHLLTKPFARQLGGGISDGAMRLMERLRAWNSGTFTTTEATKREKQENAERTVRGWLNELHEVGGLEIVEPGKGPKPTVWRLLDAELGDGGASILPTVENLFNT